MRRVVLFLATIVLFVATSSSVHAQEYKLPYPGILPDHPLYFLKPIRDNILVLFTRNPADRAELYLFFSDKRLATAKFLLDQGKTSLIEGSLVKSEEFFDKAWGKLSGLPQDDQTKELSLRFIAAIRGRQEFLPRFYDSLPGTTVTTLEKNLLKKEAAKKELLSRLINLKEIP